MIVCDGCGCIKGQKINGPTVVVANARVDVCYGSPKITWQGQLCGTCATMLEKRMAEAALQTMMSLKTHSREVQVLPPAKR